MVVHCCCCMLANWIHSLVNIPFISLAQLILNSNAIRSSCSFSTIPFFFKVKLYRLSLSNPTFMYTTCNFQCNVYHTHSIILIICKLIPKYLMCISAWYMAWRTYTPEINPTLSFSTGVILTQWKTDISCLSFRSGCEFRIIKSSLLSFTASSSTL